MITIQPNGERTNQHSTSRLREVKRKHEQCSYNKNWNKKEGQCFGEHRPILNGIGVPFYM